MRRYRPVNDGAVFDVCPDPVRGGRMAILRESGDEQIPPASNKFVFSPSFCGADDGAVTAREEEFAGLHALAHGDVGGTVPPEALVDAEHEPDDRPTGWFWYVLLSNERTVCDNPEMPEVAPSEALELLRCADEDEARAYLAGLLRRTGLARIKDADIRPVEQCGACGADFDTREPHVAVILQLFYDGPEGPQCPYCEYPSRCCPRCVSSGHLLSAFLAWRFIVKRRVA